MAKRLEADPKGHAWALLLTAHAALLERVEAALAEAGLPSLAWYDLLWVLEKADDGRLRMHDLARRVVLSRSNLTRLADRLEDAKLIAREACPEDRRGAFCAITPAGLEMRKRMWPVYRQTIDACFSRHVSDRDAEVVGHVLERVLRAERAPPDAAAATVPRARQAHRPCPARPRR